MEVMFVLLLYMNDNLKEWMGHYENDSGQWVEMGMSGCLSMKRTLKRNGWKDTASGKTRFTCEKAYRRAKAEQRREARRGSRVRLSRLFAGAILAKFQRH